MKRLLSLVLNYIFCVGIILFTILAPILAMVVATHALNRVDILEQRVDMLEWRMGTGYRESPVQMEMSKDV